MVVSKFTFQAREEHCVTQLLEKHETMCKVWSHWTSKLVNKVTLCYISGGMVETKLATSSVFQDFSSRHCHLAPAAHSLPCILKICHALFSSLFKHHALTKV